MSLEELERRIQALEDLEAIKRLKARYAHACDDHFNAEAIARLFTEEGQFVGQRGQARGRAEIMQFFRAMSSTIVSAVHYFAQPHIEVDGDRAHGLWYMWVAHELANGNHVLLAGLEAERYEKVGGEWLFAEIRPGTFFTAVHKEGWQFDAMPLQLLGQAGM